MAPSSAPNKATSRWGSLLQQAVAGVESRLDTILGEEDPTSTTTPSSANRSRSGSTHDKERPGKRPTVKSNGDSSYPSAGGSKNERLQERLAKAVVARNGSKPAESSVLSSSRPSRTASPSSIADSARSSLDIKAVGTPKPPTDEPKEVPEAEDARRRRSEEVIPGDHSSQNGQRDEYEQPPRDSFSSQRPISSLDTSGETQGDSLDTHGASVISAKQHEDTVGQMKSDYEALELRRQEETHQYLERIDALQAKLQYLTREASEIARKAVSESSTGSVNEKLAQKDEKIALLMEEGQKLSQTEMNHLSTIRRLRDKSTQDDKQLAESRKAIARQERIAQEAQEKAKQAERAERETASALQRANKELSRLRSEYDSQASLIGDLQTRLSQAVTERDREEQQAYKETLEAQKLQLAELRDALSQAQSERELGDERYRAQIHDLEQKTEREAEKAKVKGLELQGEINVLESRLESYRARAEEVSSGSSSDVHAKFLRQIEMLQNQYSVASENWQGIETSLLSRITGLENERDEMMKKEADVRRKARDVNLKARQYEDQVERVTARNTELESELAEQASKSAPLRDQLLKAEADVSSLKVELKRQKETWQAKLEQVNEEHNERAEQFGQKTSNVDSQFKSRNNSVVAMNRKKTYNLDTAPSPHHDRRDQFFSGLGIASSPILSQERPHSRRSSSQQQTFGSPSGVPPTFRQDSLPTQPSYPLSLTTSNYHTASNIPETPNTDPLRGGDRDDFFDGVVTPATPEDHRTINDMLSVSTAAAGPSVQLVERMSAAVRRLETEKAAARDELGRLTAQRDEAREQAVAVMREAADAEAAARRIEELEAEVKRLAQRYETTLEMLGEKSELVDELRADVADVKQMYRDLVESTMK